MVAPSARHMHQRNLRAGPGEEGGHDDFKDEPRSDQLQHSTAVLRALSNDDSELARFLLCGSNDGRRSNATDEREQSMGSVNAAWYPIALEPLEVRNERIIMLFEAYAIFGALFLNNVWIIYEWGNANEGGNAAIDRIFACIVAVAMVCNFFLALYGAACWMMSIMIDPLNQDFVFECRRVLTILQNLLMFTTNLVIVGLFLATYKFLSPHLPETVLVLAITAIFFLAASKYFGQHMATCMPLEFWHFPLWVKVMSSPSYLRRSVRENLGSRAKARARELRERAFRERKRSDPGSRGVDAPSGSIGSLLRAAAVNLGRGEDDVSAYEARLEEEWFTDADQLSGRGVESLSKYMPLRLAEEVQSILVAREAHRFHCVAKGDPVPLS